MRLVDILMAFPGILLNIAIVATVRRPGIGVMIFALSANGWVGYARVARGQVLALRERDFIAATLALGASGPRVMVRHLLPNLLSPLIVQMTFGFGAVIAIEASLSFLGLGPQVDYTWGAMLAQGTAFLWKTDFRTYVLVPAGAIAWVMIAVNLMGDGLDPRRRGTL
jgi:peptide/nickel transport system permease protein